MTGSLLPPSRTSTEEAVDLATARIGAVPVPIEDLWRPETCPAALLPWLAWALSVDDWRSDWTEERKRTVIAASVGVHRIKGTLASVKAALVASGWGDAVIVERFGVRRYDGTTPRDGTVTRGEGDHWAEYRVTLMRPITIQQAALVRALLARVAPARCHLKALDYTQAEHLYNATVPRDGTFSRGVS